MTVELINRILTPLVLIGFAGGFIFAWFQFRELKSALVIGLSYLMAATAFILELNLDENYSPLGMRIITDNFYLISVMVSVVGIAMRYNKPAPWKALFLIYLGTTIFGGILYASAPNQITHAYVISSGCSFLMAVAFHLVRDSRHNRIDNILYYLIMISSAQLMINAALVFYADQNVINIPSLSTVDFIAILNLTVVAISLCIAICLLLSYGIEIIGELKIKSDFDALTGLLNKGAFEAHAKRCVVEAQDNNLPLTLIVADIDFFKKVNDTYGHAVGDEVIKSFAQTLKSAVRVMDHTGRIGGEEFALLLPSADLSMGKQLAEGARTTFEYKDHSVISQNLSPTASFGVAQLQAGDSYQDLFCRADEALYKAKNAGRNQVALAFDCQEYIKTIKAA